MSGDDRGSLRELVSSLERTGFEFIEEQKGGAFDNGRVVLQSPALSVRVVRDRGTDYLEVARPGRDEWFNLELVARHLDVAPREDFPALAQAISFLVERRVSIQRLFDESKYEETREALRTLSGRIMNERYGRPM